MAKKTTKTTKQEPPRAAQEMAEPDYGQMAREAIDQAMTVLRAVEVTPETAAQVLVADHLACVRMLAALGAMEMQITRVEAALTGLGMLVTGQTLPPPMPGVPGIKTND